MRIALFILLIPITTLAQSVSVSTPSFPMWGSAEGFAHLSVEYNQIGFHYFHNTKEPNPLASNHLQSSFGVSYKPFSYKGILKMGMLLSNRPFPTQKSVRTNFIIDLGIDLSMDLGNENYHVRIYYMHISNGFGLQGKSYNDGYDSLTFRINLF